MIFQIGDKVRLLLGTTNTGGFGHMSCAVERNRTVGVILRKTEDYGTRWAIKWEGHDNERNSYKNEWLELVEAKVPFVNPTKAFVLSQKSVP